MERDSSLNHCYPKRCGRCDGTGDVTNRFGNKFGEGLCTDCLGVGYQNLSIPRKVECPHCFGVGLINAERCVLCKGTGKILIYRDDSVAEDEFREIFRLSKQEK
ncbi:MAG TPA: hypothetical protein ENH06_00610 [bacterium]|nr:hypothetical protein [bacterium]